MASCPPAEDWSKTFDALKEFHDGAYLKLDQGIKLESEGKKDLALSRYEEGLRLMDLALELRIECPKNADFTWEKACVMLQKLRKTRKEVLGRIAEVQVEHLPQSDPNLAPPPSYEEAITSSPLLSPVMHAPSWKPQTLSEAIPMASSSGITSPTHKIPNSGPMTYSELGEALNNLKVQTDSQSAEVIYTFENVRIFFIHTDGVVQAPSEPGVLRVLQLDDGANQVPRFFLQMGDWFYPLVPNVSPCLRSSYGAYILPDINTSEEGAAVGLIFPPDDEESVCAFEDFLQNVVVLEAETEDDPKKLKKRVRIQPEGPESFAPPSISGRIVSGRHHHHKKSPFKGARRKHGYSEDEHLTDDESSSRKHRRHRRKHRHRNHREHSDAPTLHRDDDDGEDMNEDSCDDNPPPYDEIGMEAGKYVKLDQEEIEEAREVDVQESETSASYKSGRKKMNKRHKRFAHDRSKGDKKFKEGKVEKGANFISKSLIAGAEKTRSALNSVTPVIIARTNSEQEPREVPATVSKSIKVARNVTDTAVNVTGYVAGKIGDATMCLGRFLAPHIQKQGTRILSHAGGMDEKVASEKVGGLLDVAAGAVEGISTIYSGLEESASILAKSLSENTVKVVKHKYGNQYGEMTDHTLNTVGNVINIHQNTKIFTPKGLAKKTAKETGKAVIYDYTQALKNQHEQLPSTSINFTADPEKTNFGNSDKLNSYDKSNDSSNIDGKGGPSNWSNGDKHDNFDKRSGSDK